MPHAESAILLGPSGIVPAKVGAAIRQVVAPLAGGSAEGQVYAAVVYRGSRPTSELLLAPTTFANAYRKANLVFKYLDFADLDRTQQQLRTVKSDDGSVIAYMGTASAEDLSRRIKASAGVYIMLSEVDESVLSSLGLPRLPRAARGSPVLLQVKDLSDVPETEVPADEATLEWHRDFIEKIPTWTAAEVSSQTISKRSNKSAAASRWLREGRIFSVRFAGEQRFPRFEFQNGAPIPVIAKVIRIFATDATGWSLAFFFANPNSYIGGRKPIELIQTDPDRVVSLAERFAHPADVF
jgi:hypothetical protein